MRGRSRLAASGACLGLLVAAAALFFVFDQAHPSASVVSGYGVGGTARTAQGGFSSRSGAASAAFKISGDVAGLYPGATVPLVLTVSNSEKTAITVTSIDTTVSGPSGPCSSTYLKVKDFSGALHVPGGHHATATVSATLSHAAPNGCQGASFPLRYTGQGHV